MRIFEFLSDDLQTLYFVFYTSFEYFVFAYFFYISISNKHIRHLLIFFSVCFLVFQTIFGLNSDKLDSYSIGIETILLFVYILFFFYDYTKNNKSGFIYHHPVFWISVGVLLYLGGSFFFNILVNHMSKYEIRVYASITNFMEIFKNLFFVGAMLITSKQHKLNSLTHSKLPFLDMDMDMN